MVPPMKTAVATLTGLVLACAVFGSAVSPAGAADVRHTGTDWSWTGPASWDAVYGTYGITISSPKQDQYIDWGFAATQCSKGSTKAKSAASFFKAQRKSVTRRGAKFTKVGAAKKVGKAFRETSRFKATLDGRTFSGELVLDYGFIDATNCNQSIRSLVAPKKNFDRSLVKLRKISRSIRYTGPGDPTP